MKLNASGKYFNIISYGVKTDGTIDYEQVMSLALEYKPAMIIVWFSSYPRSIDREFFASVKQELQTQHNHHSFLMADIAHIAGLVAGWVIDGPFDHGFDIVTTTTHKTLRGPRWALIYYNHKDRRSEKILKNWTTKITTLKDLINRGVFPWVQGGPFDHVLVAKATSFLEILDPATDWSWYCQQVLNNAKALASWLVARGWSVATWDTENHIVILDVTAKSISSSPLIKGGAEGGGITGKIAEKLLEDIGLSVNKQLIPNDPRPPLDPSWVRLGTPAITTRGLIEADIEVLVDIIDTILTQWQSAISSQRARVLELCQKYPLPY
jgi:glycine hydroxymethyltransferase